MQHSVKYLSAAFVAAFLMLGTTADADDHNAPQVTTFMVFSDAVEGREEDFNVWYETIHMAEVLALPGFVSAQRFQLIGDPAGGTKYVAVYELSGDPQAALGALGAAVASTMNMSDAMDASSVVTKLFAPRTVKMIEAQP
jgi:hypothetical protein